MMYAKKKTHVAFNAEGKEIIDAWIIADTTPDEMPQDGTDVGELSAQQVFEAGSILQVVSSSTDNGDIYFYNGTNWELQ